jgi:hypothetical protein
MEKRLESPEERKMTEHLPKGGKESREEGGFAEGEMGRGPTPYLRGKHSSKPEGFGTEVHMGTSGRGGPGRGGMGDDFKGHHKDVEHPQSHSEFEALGTEEE